MRFLVVLLVLTVNAFAQGPSSAPATEPAKSNQVGTSNPTADRDAFTFLRYMLSIRIDPATRAFNARGTVLVRNDSPQPQRILAMQISSSLKWAAVSVASHPLDFQSKKISSGIDHTGAVNEAVVTLPGAVAPGATLEVGVGYQGTIAQDSQRLEKLGMPAAIARRSDWDRISEDFTGLRGVGYVTWYPVAIEPAELGEGNRVFDLLGRWKARHALSSMQLEVTAACGPGDLLLASGEVSSGSSGTSDCRRSVTFPTFGMDVPVLVVGHFAITSDQGGDIYSLGAQQESGALFSQRLKGLIPFAQSLFGPLRRKVKVIELPESGAAPFESRATLLTTFDSDNQASIDVQAINLLAHGSVISPRAWISIGLGHYAQARLLAERSSRQAALEFLQERRPALALAEPEKPEPTGETLIKASDEVFYRTKAMYVWWMLHDIIGDAAIEKALAAYSPENDREASYMQGLLENASKQNLSWFFDDWVYRDRGLPDFRITAVYPRQSLRGGYVVSVTVENSGSAGAEVPIRLHAAETNVSTRLQVMGNESVTVRVAIPVRPIEVTVNDGSVPESDPNNNSFDVPPANQ